MPQEPIVIYEDNHLLIVNKRPGEIVQGDKTGDEPLADTLKQWLKAKYDKPGNVFLGVVHRLDRPVGGIVIFAKTSKALTRMNEMFKKGEVQKKYWAIVAQKPSKQQDTIVSYLKRNTKQNKSYPSTSKDKEAKEARLTYRLLASSERYHLIEVELHTGRHHQIRCQLASIGCPIKGDLKYGYPRSNHDGSISLLSHEIQFVHPVSGQDIHLVCNTPGDVLWDTLSRAML
ncbi:RNA pseudouridine synthase [Porphyromonas pogonae]|uniref:RluA family pseudouridine synthase n=1 Tax=Porphyromonas pogonae TaxID=867595 RepID=UPI002E75FFB6|nr:RNA pseudouridine synthase [Porphyromonas pogonae]